jgi:hypothetical protein
MMHPQAADGYSLQRWRVAVNIFNRKLWRADKVWSSRFFDAIKQYQLNLVFLCSYSLQSIVLEQL